MNFQIGVFGELVIFAFFISLKNIKTAVWCYERGIKGGILLLSIFWCKIIIDFPPLAADGSYLLKGFYIHKIFAFK